MRRRPELMQLEMGMSTRRYLPANGTAGLLRSRVSGKRRLPCPPPMMTERTLLELTDMRVFCGISAPSRWANDHNRSAAGCKNCCAQKILRSHYFCLQKGRDMLYSQVKHSR